VGMTIIAWLARALITTACLVGHPDPACLLQTASGAGQTPRVMRSVEAEPDVVVHLTMNDGRISVSGWDSNEVRISSFDAEQIEFGRHDATAAPQPVKRVHFGVIDKKGTISLQVPRRATVVLVVESSAVSVDNVAKVRVEDGGGKVDLRGVAQAAEVITITGGITLKNSTGRFQLRSVSGLIEVTDARPVEPSNDLRLFSVSGDFVLDQIGNARVEAETTTGSITMSNSFSPAARYDLKTTTGNVTLTLPGDASFQVQASVAKEGRIVNDFALRLSGAANRSGSQQLQGTNGSGEAIVKLSSFSGVVHLKRKT